jgi:glutathione synthase/RimK-type ligase-like ATP-grasp enzyme
MKNIFVFFKHKQSNDTTEYKIYKHLKELYKNTHSVSLSFSSIIFKDDSYQIYCTFSKSFIPIQEGDIFIIRQISKHYKNAVNLVNIIDNIKEELELTVYHSYDVIDFFNDKYATYLFLKSNDITTIPTIYIPKISLKGNSTLLINSAKQLGYPLIAKILDGSQGNGVIKVESETQLRSICDYLYKKSGPFLLQKYIRAQYDVRVFTFGEEILFSMKRNRSDNDFRTNISKGGLGERYDLSKEERQQVQDLLDALQTRFPEQIGAIGIDFIKNEDDRLYFIEINGSIGIEGISKVFNIDMSKIIAKKIFEANIKEKSIKELSNTFSPPKNIEANELDLTED